MTHDTCMHPSTARSFIIKKLKLLTARCFILLTLLDCKTSTHIKYF